MNKIWLPLKACCTAFRKIDQQRSTISALQVEVKQYKNRLRRIQQKQKRINIAFIVSIALLIGLLVYNLWLA